MKSRLLPAGLLLALLAAPAQTQHQNEALAVQGYPGDAPIVRLQGRTFVDLQELARITGASLSFSGNQIILTLPGHDSLKSSGNSGEKRGFSHGFRTAAIEAMASIREWGGMLLITVQNGYPVGNTMAGNTIQAYQGRAADSVALAAAAATTDDDNRGIDLLRNEFNSLQSWSDSFIQARSSMSATKLTMSPNVLRDDDEAQKLVRCGQFLAQMFAGGSFQEDTACR